VTARLTTLPVVFMIALIAAAALADAPAGYYDSVDLSSEAALRQSLHDIIDGHVRFPYTSSSTDTWDILESAEESPFNSSQIIDLYRNRTYTKFGGGTGPYNREHSWPNSYGFSSSGDTPYTDCHHLFLCDVSYNGYRGNLPFGDCTSGCTSYVTDLNDGVSGTNYKGATVWETWDDRKGDVARAMFYMDVRYSGDVSGEPDLRLTDDPSLIVTTDGPVAYMGLLSTLIQWHKDDPVDDTEMQHTDVVYSYQGNRNPFVDHPEWVSALYEGITSDVPAAAAAGAIESVYPNPFNPETTVSFSLAEAGLVRLEVYGVDGRLVRTLLSGPMDAGTFTTMWDGRDDAGRSVPSGAWFVRMSAGRTADTQKVMLLK
jgi:endonuclease I